MLTKFIEDVAKLSTRLLYKSHLIATYMEYERSKRLNVDIREDITTWKYYLNLSGEPDEENTTITMLSEITGEVIVLSKQFLLDNPDFIYEIRKGENFERLISAFPKDVLYIYGLVYGKDMNTLINAKEGEILTYDPSYVDEQEVELIYKLENRIAEYLQRYGNPEFMLSDDLYIPGLLATLAQYIMTSIIDIRRDSMETPEVCDYLLFLKLYGHMRIGEYLHRVNFQSRFYLYTNIEYLTHHIGKDTTINELVKNVLHPNAVDLLEVVSVPVVPTSMSFKYGEPQFKKTKENLYTYNRLVSTKLNKITYGYVHYNESKLTTRGFRKELFNDGVFKGIDTRTLINDRGYNERSKHNMLVSKRFHFNIVYKSLIILDTTIRLLNSHNADIGYNIVINGIPRVIKGNMVLVYLLVRLQELTKVTGVLTKYRPMYKLRKLENDVILDKTLESDSRFKTHLSETYNDLKRFTPELTDDMGSDDVNLYVRTIEHFYIWTYAYSLNLDNEGISNVLHMGGLRLSVDEDNELIDFIPEINGLAIEDLANEYGIKESTEPLVDLSNLIKAVTKINLNEAYEENALLADLTNFMRTMTSYTVEFYYKDVTPSVPLTRTAINLMYGRTIIYFENFLFDCVGDLIKLHPIGNDAKLLDKVYINRQVQIEAVDEDVPNISIQTQQDRITYHNKAISVEDV